MHIEQLLPLDLEQKRIKAKYASKKRLWGRHGGTPGAHPKSYPEELIGHLKWLYETRGLRAAIQFGSGQGMNRFYIRNVCNGSARPTVPAVRGLHFG